LISEALVLKGKSFNAGAWKLKLWERAVWSLLAEADALPSYREAGLKVTASNNGYIDCINLYIHCLPEGGMR